MIRENLKEFRSCLEENKLLSFLLLIYFALLGRKESRVFLTNTKTKHDYFMSRDSLAWGKKELFVAFVFEEEFSYKNKTNKSKNSQSGSAMSTVLMLE